MRIANIFHHRLSFLLFNSTILPLGTLRSDNGDVHENVAEKQTSHHFKLFRDYPNSPCCLRDGNFSWSRREGNALMFGHGWQNLSPCRSRSQVNLKFGHFTSQLCIEGKKCTKKHDARAELLFCSLNLLFFYVPVAVVVVVS